VFCQVYANSLLANLNSREVIRSPDEAQDCMWDSLGPSASQTLQSPTRSSVCSVFFFPIRRYGFAHSGVDFFRLRICPSRLTPRTKNVSHGLNCQRSKHPLRPTTKNQLMYMYNVLFCQSKDVLYIYLYLLHYACVTFIGLSSPGQATPVSPDTPRR
jgi:hypothetical protein